MIFQRVLFLFLVSFALVKAASISGHSNNPSTDGIKNLLKEEGRNLARIDATLKSYLGNPLTGIVYAASLAIGAISLLAMYESPLSPLPVPSLPKPPVGRFPPEHPVWPPISKHPVKLRHPQSPYAASVLNPVYELPPQFNQKNFASAIEDSSWLGPQNLAQAYAQQLGNSGGINPPRRSDYHLQPYANQMPKTVPLPLNMKQPSETPQQTSPLESAEKLSSNPSSSSEANIQNAEYVPSENQN